jgi:hypothetical protein
MSTEVICDGLTEEQCMIKTSQQTYFSKQIFYRII